MEFYAFHDSHNLFYRDPFGAVPCGRRVRFRLKTCSVWPVKACYLRLWLGDREELVLLSPATELESESDPSHPAAEEGRTVFEGVYEVPDQPGLLWYYFRVLAGGREFYYGNNEDKLGGEGALREGEPPSYQLTVYRPMRVPEWYKRGIMYQIFVERFYCAGAEDQGAAGMGPGFEARGTELGAEGPESGTRTPESGTGTPEPETRMPESGTRTPESGTRMPEPGTRMPEPGTRMPEPGTRMPESGTRVLESGTRMPEPGTRMPESGTRMPESGIGSHLPGREQPAAADATPGAQQLAVRGHDMDFGMQATGRTSRPRPNSLLHLDWYDTPVYVKDDQGRVTYWDFFGGNLEGVIAKLPYLQELGVSILYLNPIFEAASNHKYDTADYHQVDPMYGDEEVFERLVREAKWRGISLLLDGVFSHTGSDSLYFNREGRYPGLGAYQSPDSPYFEWYQFESDGSTYKCWWDVDTLPEVDELNPSWQRFLFDREKGVIQKWMGKGIAGWRLDVADELPDEFIRKLRETVKSLDSEAVLIGEVWEDASNKISYGKLRQYFWGEELDATMNYPWREIFLAFLLGERDADLVYRQVMSLYENYPRENFFGAMNLIGSHDRARILTLLGEAPPEEGLKERERQTFRLGAAARKRAVHRLKVLSLIQMTFPGVPCIYYGDEAGMEGYSDPYNRGTYPWGREDGELLEWYKKVIRLRREHEVLQAGGFRAFSSGPDVFGFQRRGEAEQITVLVNRHPTGVREAVLPAGLSSDSERDAPVRDLLSGEILRPPAKLVSIGPLSARVLVNERMIRMSANVKILGFTGSLRRKSYNMAALRAAKELLPAGAGLEIADLAPIPFFNEDVEAVGVPEAVVRFKEKIAAADALLIATPEYNYSIPPVLKNALDWASRGKDLPLSGKHLAILSASTGMFGGARVQYHLRQVCVGLNLLPLNKPEVFIMHANTKFDQDGNLTDEFTRQAIARLLQALVASLDPA